MGEQAASQAAAGVRAREIFFAESLGIEQGHRQRIAQRECGGGAGGGGEPHRAGFLRHRAVEMHIRRQRQAGFRVAGQADEVRALALDGGHDGEQLVAFAGIGQRDDHVLRGDHAEIAVAGFARMHEIGGRAGAGHGRGDLARDVAGLAHAADDDASLAGEDEVQRLQKIVVDALRERPNGIGFDVQYLTCKVERMRCGGEWFVHAPDYNSAVWGRRFFENVASSGHDQFAPSDPHFAGRRCRRGGVVPHFASAGDARLSARRHHDRPACPGLDTRCAGDAPSGRIRRGVPDVQHRPRIQPCAPARHAASGVRPGYGAGRRHHGAGDAFVAVLRDRLARRPGAGRHPGDVFHRHRQQDAGRARRAEHAARAEDHGRAAVPGSGGGAAHHRHSGAGGKQRRIWAARSRSPCSRRLSC